jgi:predicted outer membrane protein
VQALVQAGTSVADGTAVAARRRESRKEHERKGSSAGRESKEERIMLRKSLTAMFVSVFITGIAGPSFGAPPPSGGAHTADASAKLSETFSKVYAVQQWSVDVSKMADTRAKSDLVKDYARNVASANTNAETSIQSAAQKGGLTISPLSPETEEGASLIDRMKGESALLGSLQGDAFDKEYMTLVTNTQQSVLHVLDTSKASATDPAVRKFLDDQINLVQGRLRTAQNILAKVYGQSV